MNHILIRKLALTGASMSFGTVMALAMLCGVVYGEGGHIRTEAAQAAPSAAAVGMGAVAEAEKEYPISCTKLVIENLAAYDGAFYEDGSGREVLNVAALMVRNDGEQVIPYAHITVDTKDAHYIFDATMLPPGASVLIPEKNGQKLTDTQIVDYFGWNTVKDSGRSLSVTVRETDEGCLCVENASAEAVTDLTVFHRIYIPDGDFYMGGMAFETRIHGIAPGESVCITPECYVSGYSRVVYVE